MKSRHLTVVVSARIPESVAQEWRAAAADSGLPMSDWLRQSVHLNAVPVIDYRPPKPRRRFSPADTALLHAVARVGNNLNQLAKLMQDLALRAQRIDTLRCLRVLVEIQLELASVVQGRGRA
ncbi:MAG: hypothetical protein ABI702_03575 [Burkholderiales bacterium]